MRVIGAAACAALGLLLVAGCSKGGGQATNTASGAPGAPAAAAPASGPDTAITAADMPRLKAGYWETVTTTNGGAPETEHFCSSGKPLSMSRNAGHGCGTFSFKRTFLGAIVIDAACAEGPIASKIHMTASGDFNSSYTTDGQVSLTMQGKPAQTMSTHSASHWVGACPAGTTPRDE
jgi:hypothetical protein